MATITILNHNGVVIYQGNCYATAAKEKRQYEFHTGNVCSVVIG